MYLSSSSNKLYVYVFIRCRCAFCHAISLVLVLLVYIHIHVLRVCVRACVLNAQIRIRELATSKDCQLLGLYAVNNQNKHEKACISGFICILCADWCCYVFLVLFCLLALALFQQTQCRVSDKMSGGDRENILLPVTITVATNRYSYQLFKPRPPKECNERARL
jgi:hypothetical protein